MKREEKCFGRKHVRARLKVDRDSPGEMGEFLIRGKLIYAPILWAWLEGSAILSPKIALPTRGGFVTFCFIAARPSRVLLRLFLCYFVHVPDVVKCQCCWILPSNCGYARYSCGSRGSPWSCGSISCTLGCLCLCLTSIYWSDFECIFTPSNVGRFPAVHNLELFNSLCVLVE